MNLEPFYAILNKAMGLSPDSLGRSGVEHALKVRMRETGFSEKQYLNYLRSNDGERAELVEEVVVPETWFFRDSKPFDLLYETALSHRGDFRVLSAPCSTGEEPYSIAMTLMGAGCRTSHFRVDGVDISERALLRARAGIYSDNSFRAELPSYAEACFSKCAEGRQLTERVKQAVNFYAGNIVEGCVPGGVYDVVFCRNLLIYLDENSKQYMVKLLSSKVKAGGLLFVGHAEQLSIFKEYFTPVRRQGVFALRRETRGTPLIISGPDSGKPACDLHKVESRYESLSSLGKVKSVVTRVRSAEKVQPVVEAKTDSQPELSIFDVKRIADRGRTAEALDLCEELLKVSGFNPDLLHLKGLLHETEGNIPMAEDCYGKALYLAPDHIDSLVHLALLMELRGDSRKAELLRNRVRRAENRKEVG